MQTAAKKLFSLANVTSQNRTVARDWTKRKPAKPYSSMHLEGDLDGRGYAHYFTNVSLEARG
jgi:hypothetical protein